MVYPLSTIPAIVVDCIIKSMHICMEYIPVVNSIIHYLLMEHTANF